MLRGMSGPHEPIIDAWVQHPTPDFVRHPIFASLHRWMKERGIPDEIPLEATLGAMDGGGVTRALVTAWSSPAGPSISNDEVAAMVRAAPERLVGVAAVDLRKPVQAVHELRRAVKELGFKALRMLPWLWELPPDDRRYYPLYAECVELGVPFCTQVGHAGPLMASEPGRPIPYLDRVAADFPELTIVGGHVGYPWTEELVAMARKYENVFIDTSAYKPKRYPESLVRYLKTDGRRKVLFGSNYPMILPGACLSQVQELGLDDETRRLFVHDNAVRVFQIGVGAPLARADGGRSLSA